MIPVRPICCSTALRFCSPMDAARRRRFCSVRRPALPATDVSREEVLRWGWLATAAAVTVWDFDTCLAIAARQVEVARESGALAVLAVGLNVFAQAVALGGEFGKASLLIAEADAVTEATGTGVLPYGALVLAGLQGREAEASELIDATVEQATAGGQGTALQYARWASALLLNGLGRYEEAVAAAEDASDDAPELFVSAWALSELVEAASRSEQIETASSALGRLAEHVQASPTDWGLGMVARGSALLDDGEKAERLFREAIERLGQTQLLPELARAHLLYGEWLRRESRRVDARGPLRKAHDLFVGIGMEAFAERARIELRATGEAVRKRTVEARDELTAQERQIAQLARDGLSNPEIGARLFLSPRTVEWHLGKVFTKLGIRSRRELPGTLSSPESELVPAEKRAIAPRTRVIGQAPTSGSMGASRGTPQDHAPQHEREPATRHDARGRDRTRVGGRAAGTAAMDAWLFARYRRSGGPIASATGSSRGASPAGMRRRPRLRSASASSRASSR